MNQPWYIRLGWWLCKKTGHLGATGGWIHDGYFHRECKFCGHIISESIDKKNI